MRNIYVQHGFIKGKKTVLGNCRSSENEVNEP
jgi:hypothetical protein